MRKVFHKLIRHLRGERKRLSSSWGGRCFAPPEISDEVFIEMAYRVLLNREADTEGFRFHFEKIQNGEMSRQDLVERLLHSDEFQKKHSIIPLHELFLNRVSVGSPELFRCHVKNSPWENVQLNEVANPFKWIDLDWRKFAKDLKVVPTSLQGMHRKTFEWVQTLYGLNSLGRIRPESVALGVGTGHEPIVYWMAKNLKKVYATDLFSGEWREGGAMEGDPRVLKNPEKYQPFEYPLERLSFLPMDGRALAFKDNSFDVVFSLSSIEHFGGRECSSQAVKEMGRVLKPGGVAVIGTEYILNGQPHPEYFNDRDLLEYIVKASDMRLIQEINFTCPRIFVERPLKVPLEIHKTPHMSLTDGNVTWTSIILFFEKTKTEEKTI